MKFSEAIERLEAHGEYNAIGILNMLRDEKRKKVRRGPPRSTPVTPKVRRKIKELYAKGLLQSEIASHLNINQGRVSEVINGQVGS